MKKIKVKFVVFLSLLVIFFNFLQSYAQDEIKIGDQSYIKHSNTWYVLSATDSFIVNQNVVTIKFNAGVSSAQIDSFESTNGLTLLRENILEYKDYRLNVVNFFDFIIDTLLTSTLIDKLDINSFGKFTVTPDDPYYTNQWYLNQSSNADIDAPQAWDITTGCTFIKIGILDSGTDWLHEDLGAGTDGYQNIFLNPGEDAWTDPNDPTTGNKIDDDGNGFIDDWKGWNFANSNNNTRGSFFHGTHVAGIIGAKTNNTKGISGLAGGWSATPGCKMLIVRTSEFDFVDFSIVDDAILYAAFTMDVDVINISFHGSKTTAVDDALDAAAGNGVEVICSAGNDGANYLGYPASHQYTIAVGATNAIDQKPLYSNAGPDIVAPGDNIFSTQLNNSYKAANGTSFSAPIVAATVGLMKCVKPCMLQNEIEWVLKNTADKVGGYDYNEPGLPAGKSSGMGYGRLNAYKAVAAAQALNSTASVDLFMQDTPTDWGVEPNPDFGPMWISDAIIVRNQQDGPGTPWNVTYHQNPIESKGNYIYVTIRNRGCNDYNSGNFRLKLYWAKASTSLAWPASWINNYQNCGSSGSIRFGDQIADIQLFSSIRAGAEYIVEIPWTPVASDPFIPCNAEPTHFCLLARIEDPNDPNLGMTFSETNDVNFNTLSNNNIVWKNINVVKQITPFDDPQASTIVGNIYPQPVITKLEFNNPSNNNESFLKYGTIKISLGDSLFTRWTDGGQVGTGFELCDDSLILIKNDNSWLGNITLDTSEFYVIKTVFEQYGIPNKELHLNYDIVQYDSLNGDTTIRTGGVRFLVDVFSLSDLKLPDSLHKKNSFTICCGDTFFIPLPDSSLTALSVSLKYSSENSSFETTAAIDVESPEDTLTDEQDGLFTYCNGDVEDYVKVKLICSLNPTFIKAIICGNINEDSLIVKIEGSWTSDSVCLIVSDSCYFGDSLDCEFRLSQSESLNTAKNIKVFPNPSKDIVNVEYLSLLDATSSIILSDVTGRILLSEKYQCYIGDNQHQLSIISLNSGIYFIKLTIGENELLFRITKN